MKEVYREMVRLSPNRGGKISPLFIVLHHSSGSHEGTVDWILRRESKVSYHYLIHPETGDLVQMVWDSRKAWHAGSSEWKGYKGLNSYSVGIAFAGDTYQRTVSETEIDSCAKKCLYLMRKFDIPIENIITHQMCAPSRKNDCSPETHQRVVQRISKLPNDHAAQTISSHLSLRNLLVIRLDCRVGGLAEKWARFDPQTGDYESG